MLFIYIHGEASGVSANRWRFFAGPLFNKPARADKNINSGFAVITSVHFMNFDQFFCSNFYWFMVTRTVTGALRGKPIEAITFLVGFEPAGNRDQFSLSFFIQYGFILQPAFLAAAMKFFNAFLFDLTSGTRFKNSYI